MKFKTAVVFCCDAWPGLGLIRSLGEAGIRPECYCYGEHGDFLLASKYVSKGRLFKTADDVLSFLMNDYSCPNDEKPVLFTIPDVPAYLVDMHLDKLKDKFILMNAGRQGAIASWMDKRKMAIMARKHGLVVPWTIELSKDEAIPDSINYPVFTKSVSTVEGGKNDEGICWNKKNLETKKATIVSDRFLIMTYIKKKQEIDFFGMSLKGKVYIDYHDEISRFPDGAYGYYGIFKREGYQEIREKCISMIKEIGYEGLFDVEFLLGEDGILYFMEINFRVDGAIYKLTPGVNLPAEWCRLVGEAKDDLPESLPLKKNYFTGMTEFPDFRASVLSGKMNPFKWFWEFCTADRHMLINLKDPRPALVWICNLFESSKTKD